MVNFNDSIYVFDGQDNSNGGVFVSQLDGNGNIIANTPVQIQGITTHSGLSAVVFNGTINLSFRDTSNHFDIAASGNGSTWAVQQYPNQLSGTPFLGLYGGQVGGSSGNLSAVTIANDSSYSLYSDYDAQ